MSKVSDSLDDLREHAGVRKYNFHDKLVSFIKAQRPEGGEAKRALRDDLIKMLLEAGKSEGSARTAVSEAFKECGIRFRGPGGGRKAGAQPTRGKDEVIGETSAIRDIEKLYGDTTGSKRSQLASILDGMSVPTTPQIELITLQLLDSVALQPQTGTPSGSGTAAANDITQSARRAAKQNETIIVIDQIRSERAEDLAEERRLRPDYGKQLFRVGHRKRETTSLPQPDGMVPGADFYVLNVTNEAGDPVAFIEIKSVMGEPPYDVAFTRAEYLRAERCVERGVPYRLILVDVESELCREVKNFAANFAALSLSEVTQFAIRIAP